MAVAVAAVPQRRQVLLAKGGVFISTASLVGEILSFAAFLIGQAILSRPSPGPR